MNRKKKEAAEAAAASAENIAVNEEEAEGAEVTAEQTAAESVAAEAKDENAEKTEQLEAEIEQLKDQQLRVMAEYDNFRKRTAREKLSLSAEIKSDCILALLPVIDNLERAVATENADAETLLKGVEMVLNQARSIFEGMEVTSFGAVGDNFDPQLHHCVSTTEASDDFAADQITLVMQKGYMIGDKVIRPAMVQVAN